MVAMERQIIYTNNYGLKARDLWIDMYKDTDGKYYVETQRNTQGAKTYRIEVDFGFIINTIINNEDRLLDFVNYLADVYTADWEEVE